MAADHVNENALFKHSLSYENLLYQQNVYNLNLQLADKVLSFGSFQWTRTFLLASIFIL